MPRVGVGTAKAPQSQRSHSTGAVLALAFAIGRGAKAETTLVGVDDIWARTACLDGTAILLATPARRPGRPLPAAVDTATAAAAGCVVLEYACSWPWPCAAEAVALHAEALHAAKEDTVRFGVADNGARTAWRDGTGSPQLLLCAVSAVEAPLLAPALPPCAAAAACCGLCNGPTPWNDSPYRTVVHVERRVAVELANAKVPLAQALHLGTAAREGADGAAGGRQVAPPGSLADALLSGASTARPRSCSTVGIQCPLLFIWWSSLGFLMRRKSSNVKPTAGPRPVMAGEEEASAALEE